MTKSFKNPQLAAERELFKRTPEQKLAERADGSAAYREKELAAHKNMLRLRVERLAREATAKPSKPTRGK